MKREFDKLRAIKLFISIVKEGSFSKAATIMGISPSYASKEISTLEEELGVQLLYRTTRKIGLTDNGRIYLKGVTSFVDNLEVLDESLQDKMAKPKGHLKITAPSAWGQIVLAPLLAKYKREFPDISLEIDLSNRFVDIVGESFDVAIRSVAQVVDSSFYALHLAKDDDCIVATNKYLSNNGIPKTYKDLEDHNCILLKGDRTFRTWNFVKNNKKQSINVSGDYTVNDVRSVIGAAKSGMGIARVPIYLVVDDIKKGRLIPLFEKMIKKERNLLAFYSEKREHSPKVNSFLTFLEKNRSKLTGM